MKKYYIKELTENQVIHAPTREIAEKLHKKYEELGLKWWNWDSYLEFDYWEVFKEETCYEPDFGAYWSKSFFEKNGYEILTIEQLYDFYKPKEKTFNVAYWVQGNPSIQAKVVRAETLQEVEIIVKNSVPDLESIDYIIVNYLEEYQGHLRLKLNEL